MASLLHSSLIFGALLMQFLLPIPTNAQEIQLENTTPEIVIEIKENPENSLLEIEYTITEKFNQPSRGIFISLPKNQNGIWTDYTLKDYSLVDTSNFETIETPVSQIREWDQYRLRFGERETLIPNGQYVYNFTLEASSSNTYKYSFVVLRDWLEDVGSIRVEKNGLPQCSQIECSRGLTSLTINSGSEEIPVYLEWWHRFKGVINSIIITSTIGYFAWLKLAKDKPIGKINKPLFKHPSIYPWEAEFIRTSGESSVEKTTLSYILWLANNKYIHLITTNKQIQIDILKKLPSILPSIYNQAVREISKTNLAKGLKNANFLPQTHPIELDKHLIKTTAKYYEQKKINSNKLALLTIAPILLGFVLVIILNVVFQNLLIGNSYLLLVFFNLVLVYGFYIWILLQWANPNNPGTQLKKQIKQYYHYLNYVEKHKLNFSNNEENVQHYLDQIPYAASFGILYKLTDYIQKHFPNQQAASNITKTSSIISTAAFYPPSTSSGGSSSFSGSSGGFSGGGGSW